jgi:integrase
MSNGAQIATDLHASSLSLNISPESPQNLQQLLDSIQRHWPGDEQFGMLSRTADLIAELFGRPKGEIDISELPSHLRSLKLFLEERHYKRNSVKSYCNYLRILVRKAKDLGWKLQPTEAELAWNKTVAAIPRTYLNRWISGIVRYAIRKYKKPSEFSDQDLNDWGIEALQQGFKYRTVKQDTYAFRRFIRLHKLEAVFPCVSTTRRTEYASLYRNLPKGFRQELERLIHWKTDTSNTDTPPALLHREVSALSLRHVICRLHGFVEKVLVKTVDSLDTLFTKDHVYAWIDWCRDARKNSSRTLKQSLHLIHAAVSAYPPLVEEVVTEKSKQGIEVERRELNTNKYRWIKDRVRTLRKDREDLLEIAKSKKWVDYNELRKIPDKILAKARSRCEEGSYAMAIAYRDALLISFLTILAWRQRNIRECRILTNGRDSNLYKGEIAGYLAMAKPAWVKEALRSEPHVKVWLVHFEPNETKNGRTVHHVLPKKLGAMLGLFLDKYRPLLVKGRDPGTLFLNHNGRALSTGAVRSLVVDLTVEHVGKPVNPHLFRDILAVKWLEDRPQDYLTLSKILWHKTVEITLNTYGAKFDESHGAKQAEEWQERLEEIDAAA